MWSRPPGDTPDNAPPARLALPDQPSMFRVSEPAFQGKDIVPAQQKSLSASMRHFVRPLFAHRVTRRFFLMLFILWFGATILFFLPRQFGMNPSRAGLFTPAPELQRYNELITGLQSDLEKVRSSSVEDGFVDESETREIQRLELMIGNYESRAETSAFERNFGFRDPLILQYLRYIKALALFDLGASQRYFPLSVFSIIRNSAIWTIGLMSVSSVMAFVAGSLFGGMMGWPGSPRIFRLGFLPLLTASAIPYYLLGWILIWFLAFRWELFPMQGGWDRSDATLQPGLQLRFLVSALHHSILPALSVIIATAGFWAVMMRGLMVNTLDEDFMVFADAKGLRKRRIFLWYGMRNSMLPQVTGLAASVGSLLTGVLLVEIVFSYPGIGFLFRQSIGGRDASMMAGIGFVVLLLLAVTLFLLNLVLPLLDRRIGEHD